MNVSLASGLVRTAFGLLLILAIVSVHRAAWVAAASPLTEEEVAFASGSHTLAGTLTLPSMRGPHPAVILISGSGPQDRDESAPGFPGYAPFRWIADHLARHGIAVLRYDDRGVGRSTGNHAQGTTADFADDTEAAFRYLTRRKEIDRTRIGLMGHSEGGLIAAMVAARNRDVAFVISMAGPVARGYEVLVRQLERLLKAVAADEQLASEVLGQQRRTLDMIVAQDWTALEARVLQRVLASLLALPEEERRRIGDLHARARALTASEMIGIRVWLHFYITYDPRRDWTRIRVPVLALFGVLDVQVDWKQNRAPLESALAEAGNFDVTVIAFPRANHLFQEAVTGNVAEYFSLPKVFDPAFLPTINAWLVERFARQVRRGPELH